MIISARYTNESESLVETTHDDGRVESFAHPADNRQSQELTDSGVTVAPFDPWYGFTDEQIKQQRYADNQAHADDLIRAAQSNPIQGVNLDERETGKEAKKRQNRGNGKDKVTDQDDALVDHIDDVYDAQDNADDQVEAMSDRQQIIDWVPTMQTWPVWNPPT